MNRDNEMDASGGSFVAELDLLDYWLLIKKSRVQIITLAFIITLLATLVVFQMTPVYRSTAQLLIENAKSNKVLTLSDLYNEQRESTESFNSQIQILKSRPVAENVIRRLKLLDNPAMNPPPHKNWYELDWIVDEHVDQPRSLETVIKRFSRSLTIEPVIKSNVVKVSFDSTDKELAAEVANTVIEAYLDVDLESRSQMTQKANVWLTQRMTGLRNNLQAAEQKLQQYREQEGIIDNKGVVMSGTGKQFEEVSTHLVAARMRFAEAENAYKQVKDHAGQKLEVLESIPAVLKDTTVQQMKQHDVEATRILTELKSRYAPAHPKMIAAEAEQKSAREVLTKAIEAVINGITREYEIARANAAAAASAQAQSKAEIQSITRKESQLSVLQHEVDSNKQLYDTFVNRAKETEVASNLQSTAGRLVDPAVVSTTAFSPVKRQVIGIAAVLGLLAGVALVFMLDFLDSTMHSVMDVERRLRVNVLGSMMVMENALEEKTSPERAFLENPNSTFSEAIRSIRTAVLLSAVDTPHRVIAVTSTLPSEGKTTIAVNLAASLSQLKRVLLVDADMRRPSVGKSIGEGMDQGPGLVEFLAGEATLEECIRQSSSANLTVLPAGKRFKSPLELISSKKFGETIERLKAQYDLVVIDCPPLKPVSDSLVISGYANALIYVVKADATPHPLATAALKRIRDVNVPLLGVVLNLVDYKKADRYGHYEYKYGYQYKYSYAYTYGQDEPVKPPRRFLGIRI